MDKRLKTGTLKRKQEEGTPDLSEETEEVPDSSNNPATSLQITNKKNIKIRKYYSEYASYGFTSVGDTSAPNGQCVICFKTFNNSSLAPAKLLRHLHTNHSEYKDKPIELFSTKV
jgi:hypothetical protein